MAKVSIIIPIYNVEKYVEKCLVSVLEQTLKDIEIILVNDGTPDNSMNICEKYIKNDSRIVVVNKTNGGLMSAWLAGLKVATSEYIGFVDSDDWVDCDFFEKLYECIEREGADMVVGQYVSETTPPSMLYRSMSITYDGQAEIGRLMKLYLNAIFYEDNPISYCRWDKIYRRKILTQNLDFLNTNISLGEDVNTNVAVIPDCQKIIVLNNTPKYHYRINDASISNTYNEKQIYGIVELYNTLMKIAEKKSVDKEDISVFIGNMVFEEINKVIFLKGGSAKKKRNMIKVLLGLAPNGVLRAYGKARERITIRLYCDLLDRGFVRLSMFIRKCYEN